MRSSKTQFLWELYWYRIHISRQLGLSLQSLNKQICFCSFTMRSCFSPYTAHSLYFNRGLVKRSYEWIRINLWSFSEKPSQRTCVIERGWVTPSTFSFPPPSPPLRPLFPCLLLLHYHHHHLKAGKPPLSFNKSGRLSFCSVPIYGKKESWIGIANVSQL